jgi:putative membrane protein insertion efficiency factor
MNAALKFYRIFISPVLHTFANITGATGASGCRFEPTCSCYCEAAIEKHGLLKGIFKAIYRISRCHPFSGGGGYDPV